MLKHEELTNPNSCINRANEGELVFVLLGRDEAASATIRFWVQERLRLKKNGYNDPQIVDATVTAHAMEVHALAHRESKRIGTITRRSMTAKQQVLMQYPNYIAEQEFAGWVIKDTSCDPLRTVTMAHYLIEDNAWRAIVNQIDNEPAAIALDISLEKARALHRVWRALNDGDCPKCHVHRPADKMTHVCSVDGYGVGCPSCGFVVTAEEIAEIEKLFSPAMDAAVAIFEQWRKERNGST